MFAICLVGFVAVFLLMRTFDIVQMHHMQAFALFVGPALAVQALLYLKEGKMVIPFHRRNHATKFFTFEGMRLKVVGIGLMLVGIVGTIWSLVFWVSALPQICPISR